jgi:hypothetical protein
MPLDSSNFRGLTDVLCGITYLMTKLTHNFQTRNANTCSYLSLPINRYKGYKRYKPPNIDTKATKFQQLTYTSVILGWMDD